MCDNKPVFFAHTDCGPAPKNWQPLEEHLVNVANLAKTFADKFGSGEWGYLAGLWHDIDKHSEKFQQRLRTAGGEDTHIERISKSDRSTAGAQHAY